MRTDEWAFQCHENIKTHGPITDLMLDVETLGLRVGSVVPSLAIVPFYLEKGYYFPREQSFLVNIDVQSQLDAGFKVSASTLKFWMTHPEISDETKKQLWDMDSYLLPNGVSAFRVNDYRLFGELLRNVVQKSWQIDPDNTKFRVWSKPSSFDYPALGSLLGPDLDMPWYYKSSSCVRTYCRDFPETEEIFASNKGKHDPYEDCLTQIKAMFWAYKKIKAMFKTER